MVLKKIGFVVGCFGLYHLAKRFVGVRPGMFVAPDNRIYRGMPEGGPVKGIIGFVDGDKALAICLTLKAVEWSSDYLHVPETRTMTRGLEATHKILETARKEGKKAEAAEWCINYSKYGVKPGEAFLPSIVELEHVLSNARAINKSIDVLGGDFWPVYWGGYGYLSSNEYDDSNVRSIGFRVRNLDIICHHCMSKDRYYHFVVQPVFWVDLKKVEFI